MQFHIPIATGAKCPKSTSSTHIDGPDTPASATPSTTSTGKLISVIAKQAVANCLPTRVYLNTTIHHYHQFLSHLCASQGTLDKNLIRHHVVPQYVVSM